VGFRFRQGIRIFPGLRLNLSKSGVSTSLGGRGATLNISKKGIRGTVGLPGSGLSYSDMLYRADRPGSPPPNDEGELRDQPDQVRRTSSDDASGRDDALDELYLLTAHLVVESGNASTSWLQRQLRVGYNDAAELIERMERDGIVSPADRVGRRKVLVGIADLPELPNNGQDDRT
jgi:DNA segregation ATPase FtsK/SpoIIIE-like protein